MKEEKYIFTLKTDIFSWSILVFFGLFVEAFLILLPILVGEKNLNVYLFTLPIFFPLFYLTITLPTEIRVAKDKLFLKWPLFEIKIPNLIIDKVIIKPFLNYKDMVFLYLCLKRVLSGISPYSFCGP